MSSFILRFFDESLLLDPLEYHFIAIITINYFNQNYVLFIFYKLFLEVGHSDNYLFC